MNTPSDPSFPAASAALAYPSVQTAWLMHQGVASYPGLIACWDFATRTADGRWPAAAGEPYDLIEQAGTMKTIEDPYAPIQGRALEITKGQWLAIRRDQCPKLDIHGRDGHLTLIAWFKRTHPTQNCEFIAGQWNETQRSRQYGLFINIRTWKQPDRLCGHLSRTGGPTPGYKYCMDGPLGATPIDSTAYHCAAMTYDGQQGALWLDGMIDAQPVLNPYSLPGGLHDGGPDGSDFTVGAVSRSGEIGNFFTGHLSALAVFDRVLSPAELAAIAQEKHIHQPPPPPRRPTPDHPCQCLSP